MLMVGHHSWQASMAWRFEAFLKRGCPHTSSTPLLTQMKVPVGGLFGAPTFEPNARLEDFHSIISCAALQR